MFLVRLAKLSSRLHRLSGAAWALLLGLVVVASMAASDLDHIQALAQQRYGARAAETVVAWRRLMDESRALPDTDKLNRVNAFFKQVSLLDQDYAKDNKLSVAQVAKDAGITVIGYRPLRDLMRSGS